VLAYDSEGTTKWGFGVTSNDRQLRCFKLLLDNSQMFPGWSNKAALLDTMNEYQKGALDVVTDYMTELHKFAKKELDRRYVGVKGGWLPIQYFLTVPAIWNDGAKQLMSVAAKRADMGNDVVLISEPEAAAIHTLKSSDLHHIKIGDIFIVSDCGGGTSDVITYQVMGLNPHRFKEVVPGDGNFCGGNAINNRFEDFLRSRLGAQKFDRIKKQNVEAWNQAAARFEEDVKRNFRSVSDTVDHRIFFPGVDNDSAAGIQHGFIILSNAQLADLFKSVVDGILDLIAQQQAAVKQTGGTAKYIIVAGGFGESPYLFDKIEERFSPQIDGGPPAYDAVMVLRSSDAWGAVAKGAVRYGLEGGAQVTARKARLHYGISVNAAYVSGVHQEVDRYWSTWREEWRAIQMEWYVAKGDDMTAGQPILHSFSFDSDVKRDSHEVTLYVSSLQRAPSRRADTGVRRLCKLRTDARRAPDSSFKQHTRSDDIKFWRHHYHIGMRYEGGRLLFDYRVDGVVLSVIDVEFE